MKKSKFTEQQIAFALQQEEGGTQVAEVCRKMGISEATFYRWKQLWRTATLRGEEVASTRGGERSAAQGGRRSDP